MRFALTSTRAAFVALSLLAAAAATSTGCADPARQRSQQAVGSITSTRAELTAGRKQVDEVVATLAQLESHPASLTAPFKTYQRQVREIEATADNVRRRVQDMRVRATDYSNAWMEDTSQNITDADLRAKAEERNRHVRERYDAIDQQAQQVRAAYDPFITELHDLETFLSNDLTYAGVDAAKPMLGTVRSSADNLKEKVDQMLTTLDEAQTRLSPTTAPLP